MKSRYLLTVAFLTAGQLYAAGFSQSDVRPFLRIHGWLLFEELAPTAGLDVYVDKDWIVTQGGAVQTVEAERREGQEFRNFIVRGTGATSEISRLRQVVNQNKIGQIESCEIDTGGPLPHSQSEVTWYGRNGRRNSFLIVYGPGGASGLPPCRESAEVILGAIADYVRAVQAKPGSERLNSPR